MKYIYLLDIEYTGTDLRRFYISYDTFVPRNLKIKLERIKISMMESGLFHFYRRFARFKARIISRHSREEKEDETMPKNLGIEEMFFIFLMYLVLMSTAIAIFIIELIVYRFKAGRNQIEL